MAAVIGDVMRNRGALVKRDGIGPEISRRVHF